MIDPAAFAALAGVLGPITGSFLNVVIHRLPREESIVSPGTSSRSVGSIGSAWCLPASTAISPASHRIS